MSSGTRSSSLVFMALPALAALVGLVAPYPSLGAQAAGGGTASAVFVARRGTDTLLIERTHRSADSLTGVVEVRSGPMTGARVVHAMGLNADGSASGIDIVLTPPPGTAGGAVGAPAARHVNIRFIAQVAGGSLAELRQGTDTTAQTLLVAAGAIPIADASIASLGQVVRRARTIGGDSTAVPLFLLNGGQVVTTYVVRRGADSVLVITGASRMALQVDANGDVIGGGDPERGLEITRADRLALLRPANP